MQLSSFITTILVALVGTAVAVPSGSEPFPGVSNLRLPANGKGTHNDINPSGTATPFASASGFQTSARPPFMSTRTPSSASASGSASASAAAASSSARFNSNSVKQIAAAAELCPDLCQLQAESCTVALPTNRKFCNETYLKCLDLCP